MTSQAKTPQVQQARQRSYTDGEWVYRWFVWEKGRTRPYVTWAKTRLAAKTKAAKRGIDVATVKPAPPAELPPIEF